VKAKTEEVWSARNACEWVYARVRKRERERDLENSGVGGESALVFCVFSLLLCDSRALFIGFLGVDVKLGLMVKCTPERGA